jgi:transcriptional regulator with XRE-family HTH domain
MVTIIIMNKEELRQWREGHGLTLMALGDLLGVSYVTIARWESGSRKIPSFLYLALDSLEKRKEGWELKKTKQKTRGGKKDGMR